MEITSTQNGRIKDLLVLEEKSSERRSRSLFVVEGARETLRALASGFEPESFFVCGDCISEASLKALRACPSFREGNVFQVSPAVYDRIARRGATEGVMAVMRTPKRTLDSLQVGPNPLVLVLEALEKPGNIGAVLRSADAAGVDAVLLCDPLTDLYNPNLIRASLGAVFSVPIAVCTSQEALKWIRDRGISVFTAQLQDSSLYYDTDMKRGTALVMGTEDEGLSDFWRKNSDRKIRIPMAGMMDSLNVSVSAAILCFEAVRQRRAE